MVTISDRFSKNILEVSKSLHRCLQNFEMPNIENILKFKKK